LANLENPVAVFGTKLPIQFALSEALDIVIGYAFGTDGVNPSNEDTYLFAYRSYDCALLNGGSTVTEGDVFASVGLNSGISAAVILKILALIDEDPLILDLSQIPDFWLLNSTHLKWRPKHTCDEEKLWAAYDALTSLDGVAGAVAGKILHHRYPTKYPIYDSYIGSAYSTSKTWGEICEDVKREEDWFIALEELFESFRLSLDLATSVPLGRLRLLDILVWSNQIGKRQRCLQLGSALRDNPNAG